MTDSFDSTSFDSFTVSRRQRRRRIVLLLVLVDALVMSAVVGFYVWKTHHKPAATAPPDGQVLTLDCGNGVALDLHRIEPGEFVMGSPPDEADRDESEGPQHTVHFAKPFYMGQYEVTQKQWVAVMGGNQSLHQGDGDLPAEGVSWGDCQKFCRVLSERTHRTVRLPTEAEWEYACRAGSKTPYATGAELNPDYANFAAAQTLPVGRRHANAWELYDMEGNVAEWCMDVFHDDYKGAPTDGSAWQAGAGTQRDEVTYAYRGGAYKNDAPSCRSAYRACQKDNERNGSLGFRVVVEAR